VDILPKSGSLFQSFLSAQLTIAFMHYTIRFYCESNQLPKSQEDFLQIIQPADQTPNLMQSLNQWLSTVTIQSSMPGELKVINSSNGSVSKASCKEQSVTPS
jgi:hypothetical protein